MLYYVTRELHSYTIDRVIDAIPRVQLPRPDFLQAVSYETLFALKRAPIGNYVFTDIDRLSGYEIDAAAEIARSLAKAAPTAMISNPPNRVLGRYALLRRLYETGINSFNVWRLDEERMPTAYPVFIRREHDAFGPESPLLRDEREYRAAVAALLDAGKGLTGRIAVQFVSTADQAGLYHKFGAFCFRGRIVPQHLMISDSWNVKRGNTDRGADLTQEEESYVRDNPHAEQIRRIFQVAEIDFGRADYCVVNGRIEVFEINTNPTFPHARFSHDRKMIKRKIVLSGVYAGFKDLDAAPHGNGLVRFKTPRPKMHRLRNRPWSRRIRDLATLWRWRTGTVQSAAPVPIAARDPQPEPK